EQLHCPAAYRPTQPNAHYRRVACLVLDGPVFLDLIGTCHSGHQKPAILKPEHLVLHTLQQDCRQNSPHATAALRGGHKIESDQKGLHSPQFMSATAMEDFYRGCLGHTDPLCLKSSLSLLRVSVAPTELLFNHKHTSSSSPSSAFTQSVSITNHTRRKLGLMWTAAQESPFSISPSSCDLAPLKSALFVWLCLTVTDHTNMTCIHCCTSHYFILFLTLMSFDVLCQVVQIHPDRGRLCPGECALCVLTFTSTDYPTVHQLDVICQVTQPHHRKV
uniref:Uncharacterized protein n=1 Tax=Neolamprologus brichardi TaxID=32507 RepID=A0A3Q4HII0_NEOBR